MRRETKTNVSDLEESIFVYSNLLYFVCGMYSNINTTMLHEIFEILLQLDEWLRLILPLHNMWFGVWTQY